MLLALALSGFVPGCGARPGARPDIVLLVVDDAGWNDVFPSVATPNLERLAQAGTTFRSAFSMPICTPSRYALLFGRYGRREGVLSGARAIAPGEVSVPAPGLFSVADLLRGAGYSTAAFGKWHVDSPGVPLAELVRSRGFQTFRAGTRGNLGRDPEAYTRWKRIDDGVESECSQYATVAVGDAFLEWWAATEGPRFAYVAFHAPHQPFHVPPFELLSSTAGLNTSRGRFEASVRAFDRVLGDILNQLDLTNTLVLFVSDNGTPPQAAAPGDVPERQKASVFDGGVHVPMVVAGPGVRAGAECRGLVHLVDFVATLGEVLGVELPVGAAEDSVSFADLLRDPTAPGRRETVFFELAGKGEAGGADEMAVRSSTHLLRVVAGTEGREELYHLASDPGAERPLDLGAESNRAILARLRSVLDGLPPRRTP